jgi:hypothetical protein
MAPLALRQCVSFLDARLESRWNAAQNGAATKPAITRGGGADCSFPAGLRDFSTYALHSSLRPRNRHGRC